MKYSSDFKYTPHPYHSPCYKGKQCHHKQETVGRCRENCLDYSLYEEQVKERREAKTSTYVFNEYKQRAIDITNRRYR